MLGLAAFNGVTHTHHEHMRRDILYFTVLGVFVIAFIVTVLGICGVLNLDPQAKTPLVIALLVEVAGSVVALFKKTDFFKADDDAVAQRAAALKAEIAARESDISSLISEIDALKKAHAREVLHLQAERSEIRRAKDEALETLAKYKDACHKDISRLKSEIEELRHRLPSEGT